MKLKFKNRFLEYLLTYLMIAFSGIPFFTGDNFIWAITYLILVFVYVVISNQKFDSIVFILTGSIVIVYIFQAYFYGYFSLITILTLVLKFSYPYFSMRLVGKDFARYYINVMYVIGITSFIFYAVFFISPDMEAFFRDVISPIFYQKNRNEWYEFKPSFILYTMNMRDGDLFRNSGPFWEPGGFAVFLFIALILNYSYDKNLNSKKNILFIISIISTLSTAGFVTLLAFFILKGVDHFRPAYIAILIILIIPISAISYQSLPFLKDKVDRDLEIATTVGYEDRARNRFTSALIDLQIVKERPFLGDGKNNEMRSIKSSYFTYLDHRNNGVTALASNYGLPFTILFFVLMYRSLRKYYKHNSNESKLAIMAMVVVLLQGFSQVVFEKPMLIVLIYLSLTVNESDAEKNSINAFTK